MAALRRRGGGLVVLGGGLLLAAAVTAVISLGNDESENGPAVAANSLAVIDPESNRLTSTVPTGAQPAEVAADADYVWVANRADDTVTQVDPVTKEVVGTASPGTSVAGLAAGADGVWIGDSRRETLVRLDPASRSVADSIRLAAGPEAFGESTTNPVAVGQGAIWVGRGVGEIARVDPKSDAVVAKIPVGNGPVAIAAGAGAGGVWIADEVDNSVARIDPASANAVTAGTPVGQGPSAVAVGEGAVWVANTQDDTVARIDPATAAVTATISVGRRPTGVAAGGGAVWVANSLSGTVSRIDPETNLVEATVEVGEAPQGVTVAHDLVWVSVQARAAPPAAAPASSEGDTARVLIDSDPGPTDPAISFDVQRTYATCALLYNYPDRPFPEGARLKPEVAMGAPSISSDGRVYTFRLRSGFSFSPPSNEPVTAEAFERAIERVLHPRMGSLGVPLMGDIVGAEAYIAGRSGRLTGVRARGDTLVIELTKPVPDLLARLAAPYFCAVPPGTPITSEGIDALPSAGPYYIASYVPNRSLVLRRNPNYAGQRPQGLEQIEYEIGVPVESQIEEVEAGRADYVSGDSLASLGVPGDAVERLSERYGPAGEAALAGRQQLFTQPTLTTYFFVFNTTRGLFADARLRRAVNYAVDRPALADHTGLGERGRPTDQYIPPGMPGFDDAAIYPLGGPDLATARRLAGRVNEDAVLYTCDLPGCTSHAEILRSNLRAIGIELDVRQFPVGILFARTVNPGEPFDLAYSNWFADYADPANFTNYLFGTEGEFGSLYEDSEMERRLAAAAGQAGDARLRAYAELDVYLAHQAVPAVPFASGTVTHFLSARMDCQVLHPIYGLDLAALCVRDDADDE